MSLEKTQSLTTNDTNPNSMHNELDLLLSKYKNPNSSELQNLQTENEHLRKILASQYEIIQAYELKYQDLSIEYNTKIDKLRKEHEQNIAELHEQFRKRLSAMANQC